MKKISAFLSLMMLGCAVGAAPAAKPAAPEINAADYRDGFEKNTWWMWHKSDVKVTYKPLADEGHKDKGSLAIIFKPQNKSKNSGNFIKDIPAAPNKEYYAEVMVRRKGTDENLDANLSVHALNSAGQHFSSLKTAQTKVSDEYTKLAVEFTAPRGTGKLRFFLSGGGGTKGMIVFDDFKVYEMNMKNGYKSLFYAFRPWHTWKSKDSKVKFSWTGDDGRNEKGAIKITNPGGFGGSITRTLPVTPGLTYTFVVYTKSKGLDPSSTISLGIQGLSEKRTFLGLDPKTTRTTADKCAGEWKRLVLTLTIPTTGKWKQVKYAMLTFSTSTSKLPGEILFDDFDCFQEEEEEL